MKFAIQLSLLALICSGHTLLAQAPKGINYQGIARDMDGKPLAQKEIAIQISILKESSTGELEFDEIHEVRTNSFGLFTLVIGQGQAGTGSFNFISWALGDKWLQIELDENGGRNFKLMGTQQLMSVPYALYAEYAGNGYAAGNGISISNNTITNTGDGDTSSSNELISSVSFGVDNKLKITDAGGTKEADLSSLVGASQNLNSVLTQGNNAGGVTITNLGSPVVNTDAATKAYVDSHTDADPDPTNEIQDLTLVTNNLRLTNNPGASNINLTPYLDNTDSQDLTSSAAGTNRTINISGGASTTISVADNDNSITNEIQDLNLISNSLSLSSDPTPVDLTPFLDNTDNQNLSSSVSGTNRTINISGGTGTTINVADNDNSATNEIQTISTQSVDANTRSLTLTSANTVNVDVRDADSNSTNELQNLTQVLSTGNNAGANRIANVGNPTATQDATTKSYVDAADLALSNLISTTYAFKASFDFTNSGGVPLSDQTMPFTSDFDDFGVLNATTFTAAEAGTYLFFIEGFYNTVIAGGSLSLLFNSVKYPVTIVQPFGATQPRFSGTFMFKLTAGQTVRLIGDNVAVGAQFNGKFFGNKL